jgi:hypothetical protein
MNNSTYRPLGNLLRVLLMVSLAFALTLGVRQTAYAAHLAAGRAPVDLGSAASFVVLTKTGITNVPTSDITGNLGASPISSTAITGFSLVADSTNTFSRSSQVTGKIYAANYKSPTPANLTTSVSDMQTAYTDAAGRSIPDFTELYAGNLSGRTLTPGLYKWSSGVLITSDMTLAGPSDGVWIFQVAGNLTMGSGAKMLLSGGAKSRNIFWQVGGGVGVEIGTTAHVEGTLLAAKAIHFRTGASLNGRALAQTAVTLASNKLVIPTLDATRVFTSDPIFDGWVLESGENSSVGGTVGTGAPTFVVGDSAANQQYRSILHFDTSGLPDTAVVTKVTLKIMKQSVVGTNPFGTHGALRVDIRKPYFGPIPALQPGDFQATPSASWVAQFFTPVGSWYSAVLSDTGNTFVNSAGLTQFRLRFTLGDNNNHVADYVLFYSGDAAAANRPQLVVQYYVP